MVRSSYSIQGYPCKQAISTRPHRASEGSFVVTQESWRRFSAASELEALCAPEERLRALLDDPDQAVRQAATKALVRRGDPVAVAKVIKEMHADDEWERENVLQRLVEGSDVECREIASHLPREELLHMLQDEWWPVGFLAARLIATFEEYAPFTEILALLSHPSPQVRWAALRTLELLGEHLSLSQSIPLEPVLSALDAEDIQTRRQAASVLDSFGSRVPVDRLLPLLEEEDTQVARTLARLGRQEGRDALAACLRTRDQAWQAAKALGELGTDAPAEPLLAALNTSDRSVRQAVAEALYKTHPELLPHFVPELVRTLCIGQVGPLLEPLRHISMTRTLAALRHPAPVLLAWFERALDSPWWEVRMWAILGLKNRMPMVSEKTREKLQWLLDDHESASVRQAARRTLDD